MKQHFVTFYSPGTFVAEQTTRPIKSWHVATARRIAATIIERYGAVPYAFQFSTRTRTGKDLDSKVSNKSPLYYINCIVETLEEIEKRNDERDSILLSNMRCNGWKRIAVTTKGWRWSQPLRDGDVIL